MKNKSAAERHERLAVNRHRNDPLKKQDTTVYTFNPYRRCDECGGTAQRSLGKWFSGKWYCNECAQ